MNIDYTLRIMELERQAMENRLRHETVIAKARIVQDALQAGINLYVGMIAAQMEAIAWGLRATVSGSPR